MVRPEIRRAKLLEKIRTIEVKYPSINYLKSQYNLYSARKEKAKRRKTIFNDSSMKSYYNDFRSYTSAKKSLEKLNNDAKSNSVNNHVTLDNAGVVRAANSITSNPFLRVDSKARLCFPTLFPSGFK